jgi:sugar lactone lactonase YvrE
MVADLEVVAQDGAIVGESPMWSGSERALYWLDGRRDAIYRIVPETGVRASWTVPSRVNALALARRGLIVAMKSGLALLDTTSGAFTPLAAAPFARADMRMNDAKIDRAGRFWFGTMQDEGSEPAGRLYRLDPDLTLTELSDPFSVPNGFAWSPDDARMFVTDSRERTIFAYDFDRATGAARDRRAFATPPRGSADGATTDSAGYLWSACPGGSALARYAPNGAVERIVELPFERPTSVVFGGSDLRTLFITTATRTIPPERLAAQPLAGAVLALRVDVPGLPEPVFTVRS